MRQIALIVTKDESQDTVFDRRVFVSALAKEPVEDNPKAFVYKIHLSEDIFDSHTVTFPQLKGFQDFLYENFGLVTMPHIGIEYEVEEKLVEQANEKINLAIQKSKKQDDEIDKV